MTDSDVETGSAAYIGIRRLWMDQELATATRGRVQLVIYKFVCTLQTSRFYSITVFHVIHNA
jgi:hypothetical protein